VINRCGRRGTWLKQVGRAKSFSFTLIFVYRVEADRRKPNHLGVVIFVAGFVIWVADNAFCHHLSAAKNHVLLPWSIVLEGHGWWHILTGLGE